MDTIKKILVPIDFSDYSKQALRYTVTFAKNFNAMIYMIYVIEPMIYPADFSMGQIAIPSSDIEIDTRAKEELETLAKNEIKPEIDYDILIIATHGHTGMEHLLFGSTAEKVVRKAPCPVLTLREPIKGFRFKA